MSLRDEFARAWAKRRGLGPGWIVNLEPTYNLDLGAVGVVAGGAFNAESTLERRGITGLPLDDAQNRSNTPWQFQSNDQISVELGSTGQTAGPVAAVGNANYEVQVSFGAQAGVSIYGSAMWWRAFADIGTVRAAVVDAARRGLLHKGESIVITQQLTGQGVMFSAEGENASLKATAAADVAPGGAPSIASLSGNLVVAQATSGAQMQVLHDGAVLAARVLYLGYRGFLWWRDFEAYGAVSVDPDQIEETVMVESEGEGDDEYVALI